MKLLSLLAPEILLIVVACVLFFLGTSARMISRKLSALIAFGSLATIFVWQLGFFLDATNAASVSDDFNIVRVGAFATYFKMIVSGVGALLILLAWPSNADGTGSGSINFGSDTGEFFALALLSLAGVFLVAEANDIILLFLGIELAAIPTYIMVSVSRPLPVAQEAGVKYFFLGAMAAAVMLFGFSYVYGSTGSIKLNEIAGFINSTRGAGGLPVLDTWFLLGIVMLLAGFAFKIAAVPLHAYAGDVYQGAATPVTAMLAFIPKTSGFVAIIKLMSVVGGSTWAVPELLVKILWVVAALTMTFGNVLGLLQLNVKRVFAYSSIAHSGYMLVGITALVGASQVVAPAEAATVQTMALQGVLFYLLSYGIMNVAGFGVLMMLPSRSYKGVGDGRPAVATTAETFEDIAGQGRAHPFLGLAMAVCCFSLIGLPLTVGFFGKFYLIRPAALLSGDSRFLWLVVITMLNAAISAAYYLKIVATMFIRPLPVDEAGAAPEQPKAGPALITGVFASVVATLFLGVVLPFTDNLTARIGESGGTVYIAGTPMPVAPPATTQPATTQPAATQPTVPVASANSH